VYFSKKLKIIDMKKISKYLLMSMITCLFQFASAQTLEHVYHIYKTQFFITDIGNNDYKYVFVDSTGFSIYNLDHSPYLINFVPPVPIFQPPSGYQIAYITKSLFDCDSTNLEYVITAPIGAGNFYVYRTDGTLLFEKDTVQGPYGFTEAGVSLVRPINNTPDGAKLMLFNRQPITGELDSMFVYSLCGTLPYIINELSLNDSYIQIFPNPTNGIINFNINLPNNLEKFKLTIYNSSFQVIEEAVVNSEYQFDTKARQLSSGIYLFDLSTSNKVYQTGKFILNK
jgi:hypothetical protein